MKDLLMKKQNRSALVAVVIGIISLIVYIVYGVMYSYFDTAVLGGFVLGIVFTALDALLPQVSVRIFSLLAVFSYSFGLGIFFMNSFPVWADRLNGITMYGSRGTLVPVVAIMVLMILLILFGIVKCFGKEE